MKTWRRVVALGVIAAAVAAAGSGWAEEPAPRPTLDLSIRAGALGIAVAPVDPAGVGLEAVKAPTDPGSIHMPRVVPGRQVGVYVGVVVCEPDGTERLYQVRLDDAGNLPERSLRGTAGPRALVVPGRPIPY